MHESTTSVDSCALQSVLKSVRERICSVLRHGRPADIKYPGRSKVEQRSSYYEVMDMNEGD